VRRRPGPRTTSLPARVLLACALLAGCQAGPVLTVPPPLPAPTGKPPVPRECVFEACHGRIGDSEYAVSVPARWNGTLLLYVPGFERVYPTRSGRPVALATSPRVQLGRRLFDEGYALAGATYAWGGWSVAQSVAAAEAAYRFVREHVGVPQRVYAWGRSMGGLVSVLLAERHPDWVTAAAPACGVLGGTTRFYDMALDVAYAVRTLLVPGLPLDRYGSYAAAAQAYSTARAAVLAAKRGNPGRQAQLMLIADLVHAPGDDTAGAAAGVSARVAAAVQVITNALPFSTYVRWDLESRYGGAFSTNTDVDYSSRIDAAEQAALDRLAPGVAAAAMARLAGGQRVAADPAVRAEVDRRLDPTGVLQRPVVTLHDAVDPVAPVEHEAAYAAQVAGHGRGAELMQLVSVPPPLLAAGPPPYGAGHCRFTDDELHALITVLNEWATTGRRPDPDAVKLAFGTGTGLDLNFTIPPWPGAR
jgi:pimeloyl-ACP methyl ester carboxylesterase